MSTARSAGHHEWDRPAKPWALPAGIALLPADADRAAWLTARRSLIGASDVAAVVGASKYGDAYSVWADKTGRAPDRPPTDAMVRGTILEDGVVHLWAARFADGPLELRRQGLVRSREFPHAGATVDRLSICTLGRCIVEVKTQSDLTEWLGAEVPTDYQIQGQWQLGVTGRDHVHFVVLGPRLTPLHRIMYRDDELIDTLLTSVARDWWNTFITGDTAPTPTARSAGLVRSLHGNPPAGARYVLADDPDTAEAFRALPGLKAEAERAVAAYENAVVAIQARVGDATEVLWDHDDVRPAATWRASKQIDGCTRDFIAEHRELVEPYLRIVETEEVDVAKLVENHPDLIAERHLRYRRTWSLK